MSSTRDNVSLYNNSQDNMLSYIQNTSYSHIGADNQTIPFDFIDNFSFDKEKEDVINQNFKWLELQLLKNHRQISAFDYYKIEGSFKDSSVSTADLLKNHSLICNGAAEIGREKYSTGDLLYKKDNGQLEKIPLWAHYGLYRPVWNENNIFSWEYFSGVPEKEPQSITLKLNNTNTQFYYGEVFTKPRKITEGTWYTNKFDVVLGVPPVIKGYNAAGEEVFWDITLVEFETEKEAKIVKQYQIQRIPFYIVKIVVK